MPFCELVDDQQVIEDADYDVECLEAFFKGCPKLREVTILFEAIGERECSGTKKRFCDALIKPSGDEYWDDQGISAIFAVAEAADQLGVSLESLTLDNVSPRFIPLEFNPEGKHVGMLVGFSKTVPTTMIRQLRQLLRPLKRLRITIAMYPDEDEFDAEYVMLEDQTEILASRGLQGLLSEAQDLRVLKLSFLMGLDESGLIRYMSMSLSDALGDLTCQHLYELPISNRRTEEEYLL